MSKEQSVPRLRFPGFSESSERGQGGWERKRLGDYVDIKSGLSPASYQIVSQGLYPYIKVEDLNNCDKYQYLGRFYSNDGKNVVPQWSVIFPKRGAAILNNKIRVNAVPVLLDTNMMALSTNPRHLHPEFLYYLIYTEELYKIADTSTIPQINNKHIEPYNFSLPALPEQTKIADFLTAVDERLQILKRKKALLEQYKKGMMQRLFSQELRFKDADGKDFPDWEERRLGEVAQIRSGSTPLRSNSLFFEGGIIPWVKTTDLNNSLIFDTEEKVTEAAKVRINPVHSVLVAMYGGFNQIGRTGYLMVPAATNQALSVLNTDEKLVLPKYLLIWLNAKVDAWKSIAGSSRKDPNITGSDVAAFPISYPSLAEQTKIADFLSSLDAKIQVQQGLISRMETWKKGLLQAMFVG
ncbi:MAG: restriction endonuclease subunit S [Bacteroidia bacterium]